MFINPCHERDDLGDGLFRSVVHVKPVAYRDNGALRYIVNDWQDSGIPDRPHIVTQAPFIVSATTDGKRRIHPTRDMAKYFEIGAPYAKVAGVWTQAELGEPQRDGSILQWTRDNFNIYVSMNGHYVKMAILLTGGWQPEDGMFAFPVGLTGLTRSGGIILDEGQPVMRLRRPVVYDYANQDDSRPIAHQFVQLDGQWYILFTLPDLAGMSLPVIDPTYSSQPDSAGIDTYLKEGDADDNAGDTDNLDHNNNAGGTLRRHILIKFDLSSIPGGATVSSGTLSLWWDGGEATIGTFYAHAILSANSAWTESDATWNYAVASTTRWAGDSGSDGGADAGCSQSGTDYNAAAMGSTGWDNPADNEEIAISLNAAQVETMIANNYGFFIRGDQDGIHDMHSSDAAAPDAAYRPKLVIEYTTAGQPISLRATTVPYMRQWQAGAFR
jgi:hypothetical protein